jgi:MFS family permease
LRRSHPARQRRIDYLGAALLTASTTAFLLVLALGGSEWPWTSPQVAIAAGAAVVLAALFILHVLRVPEPVLPPELFRDRLFVVACTVLALTFMGMLGASLFFPLFFQVVMGFNPAVSGFLTGPLMAGVVISSIVNGRLLLRSGRYKPAQIVGLIVATISFAVLSWGVATAQTLFVIESAMFSVGLGLGLVMPNMTIAVQNALPAAHRGVGTATLAFFRSLGGLIGVTGSGAILALQLHVSAKVAAVTDVANQAGVPAITGLPPEAHAVLLAVYRHAIATVFVTGVCTIGIALIALLFLPELPLRADHRSADRAVPAE